VLHVIVLKMWSHFDILLFKIIWNNIKRAQFEQGLVPKPWSKDSKHLGNIPIPKVGIHKWECWDLLHFTFQHLWEHVLSHGQLGLSFGSFPLSCPNHCYKSKTRVVTLTWHTNNLEPWIIVYFKLFIHLYIIFKA
jgi:hypothetical protein